MAAQTQTEPQTIGEEITRQIRANHGLEPEPVTAPQETTEEPPLRGLQLPTLEEETPAATEAGGAEDQRQVWAEMWRTGQITEEEYDSLLEAFEEWELEKEAAGEVKYSIGELDAAEKENTAKSGGERYSISNQEIKNIQSIGDKSLNAFTTQDINATALFAKRYWIEMGVKSPFFRAWFGDWRHNDKTLVKVAVTQGDTRVDHVNIDTGWTIRNSGRVHIETKTHRSVKNREAVPYLPYIDEIIVNAVLLDSSGVGKIKSENSLLMHYLYSVVDIGNGPEVLKLTVEEMYNPVKKGTHKRAYALHNIEKAFAVRGGVQSKTSSSGTATTNAINTVADLFAAVKRYDADFNPKPCSLVVNPDGTPKVMYHGTRAENGDFYVFDESKAVRKGGLGFKALGKGNYFTAKKLDGTERYGSRVIVAYLNIRNPFVYQGGVSFYEQVRNELGIDPKMGADAVQQEMRKLGYDGVIQYDGNGEVSLAVTFDSEQIKSATDNIGTFDGSNPDIRYSITTTETDTEEGAPVVTRQGLNYKARQHLADAERDLLNFFSYHLGVSRMARREDLLPVLREICDAYLENDTVSNEKVEELFDKAYEAGRVIEREFYDNYKHIKDHLRNTPVTISKQDQSDIADYGSFRKRAFGTLRITNEGGLPVDTAYQELREMAPELFPESITHPGEKDI